MKHSGRARKAAFKLILITLIAGTVVCTLIWVGTISAMVLSFLLTIIAPVLLGIWVLFCLFTLYFFRDPTPKVPNTPNVILSPAHGKVDVVDKTTENEVMSGECHRISIFLSVIDIHVQNAPVTGKVSFYKYTMGEFMNAVRSECASCNENVLLGFEATDPAGLKMGVRLIAGVIARRIVPFVKMGDEIIKGERISLIQFGSRADIYLPLSADVKVKVGDRAVGGETVLATYE
jgi:phosphatidylserine decarboxylase